MLDVIEQLQRYGDAVTETVDPVRPDTVGSVATAIGTRRRRPVWQPLLAAAAVVALLVGGYWLASSASDSAPPAAPSPSSTSPATSDSSTTVPRAIETGPHPAIQLLDAGPLTPRAGAAVAWTGKELVVWGGVIPPANQGHAGIGDGAAYNPSTHQWQEMADGPLPTSRDTPHAVSTDSGVVIARGTAVALWSPTENTWRKLDDAPAPVDDLTSIGTQLISASANATLDLASGHWKVLPAPPAPLTNPVAAWNGTELIVLYQAGGPTPNFTTAAVAFDPGSGAWHDLPAPPGLDPAALSADRDGDRVVFADFEMHAAEYRAGAWEALPPVPARFYEYPTTLAAVSPAVIVSTAKAVAVLSNGLWTPLPKDELAFWDSPATVVPAGTLRDRASLFVFGVDTSGENHLALVDPEQLAASASTLQVGEMTLRIPTGMKLVHSDYTTHGPQEQTVLVTLSTPTGNCDVTSTYDNGAGGGTHPWSAYASGLTWSARATATDAVKVVCGSDPATAKQIVDATSVPIAAPGTGG